MPTRANEFGKRLDVQRNQPSQDVAELRDRTHEALVGVLVARGASRSETEEILASVWADCVPSTEEQPSLLDKYSGKCTLQGWLATVATDRWIVLKSRQMNRAELLANAPAGLESHRSESAAPCILLPRE